MGARSDVRSVTRDALRRVRVSCDTRTVEAHVRELADLVVRWVHLIAGIMWIGNSLLFNWLDRNLEKPKDAPPGWPTTTIASSFSSPA